MHQFLKIFFCFKLVFCSLQGLHAQCTLYPLARFEAQPKYYRWGHHILSTSQEIRSVQLEDGAIAIFFENGDESIPGDKYLVVTKSTELLNISFAPKYLLVFRNPDNQYAIAFEHAYLKGSSNTYDVGIHSTPDNFGISSLYVPVGKKAILSVHHPELRADYGIPIKLFDSGIHFFVGEELNDINGYIQVINTSAPAITRNAQNERASIERYTINKPINTPEAEIRRKYNTLKRQLGTIVVREKIKGVSIYY